LALYFYQMLPKKILLSKGNSYLGWIRCNLLGKNTYKVAKIKPALEILEEERWKLDLEDNNGYKYSPDFRK
jgi:hypothetical protein